MVTMTRLWGQRSRRLGFVTSTRSTPACGRVSVNTSNGHLWPDGDGTSRPRLSQVSARPTARRRPNSRRRRAAGWRAPRASDTGHSRREHDFVALVAVLALPQHRCPPVDRTTRHRSSPDDRATTPTASDARVPNRHQSRLFWRRLANRTHLTQGKWRPRFVATASVPDEQSLKHLFARADRYEASDKTDEPRGWSGSATSSASLPARSSSARTQDPWHLPRIGHRGLRGQRLRNSGVRQAHPQDAGGLRGPLCTWELIRVSAPHFMEPVVPDDDRRGGARSHRRELLMRHSLGANPGDVLAPDPRSPQVRRHPVFRCRWSDPC